MSICGRVFGRFFPFCYRTDRKRKKRVQKKVKDGKYIAYFQAYTGTYVPKEKQEKLFGEAIHHPDVVALSVATRRSGN